MVRSLYYTSYRYYVDRANAPHTCNASVLVQRSDFRPLTRVRYELIGQDRALEQLFKDLSIHSRQLSVTPIVILLCGMHLLLTLIPCRQLIVYRS